MLLVLFSFFPSSARILGCVLPQRTVRLKSLFVHCSDFRLWLIAQQEKFEGTVNKHANKQTHKKKEKKKEFCLLAFATKPRCLDHSPSCSSWCLTIPSNFSSDPLKFSLSTMTNIGRAYKEIIYLLAHPYRNGEAEKLSSPRSQYRTRTRCSAQFLSQKGLP